MRHKLENSSHKSESESDPRHKSHANFFPMIWERFTGKYIQLPEGKKFWREFNLAVDDFRNFN